MAVLENRTGHKGATTAPDLKALALKANTIRQHIIRMLAKAGSGHPGGSLSATDIGVALYFHVMNYDPKQPKWPDRDRLVLSKGHATAFLYSTLAEAGFFPTEDLATYRELESYLEGHPDMRKIPGVEASTGSLGQGLSMGIGMALAARLDKKTYRTYVILSDGENDEGQTWEAAMFAAHFKMDNLTALLDYNKFQLDGSIAATMGLEPLADKWRAFGWKVFEADGHSIGAIIDAVQAAHAIKGQPSIIICHTIKGKGVSFMENNNSFHGVAPTPEEAKRALEELAAQRKEIA